MAAASNGRFLSARKFRKLTNEEQSALSRRVLANPSVVSALEPARTAMKRGDWTPWNELKRRHGGS